MPTPVSILTPGELAFLVSIPQAARYGAVSVLALALDTGVYVALAGAGIRPAAAGAIGYVLGLVLHFLLSRAFVFDAVPAAKGDIRLFVEFAATGVAGLALTALTIAMATAGLGLDLLTAKAIAVAASFTAVYLARRTLVFAAP